ncbi:Hypothetical predicted protein [Pelobates cultripes]|uniref:Sushi domain-containing protein n=1 Tax=Pelobates cultripes TaxID=61616 RepID=A0AAD1VLQ3_PELCU|nr:Hypothetical predicted protein [Pelobates cultripes]
MLRIALVYSFITVIHCVCGPPKLPYGMLKSEYTNQETYPAGSKVQFVCIPGYVRIPGTVNTLFCFDNSKWAPEPDVFCKRRTCVNPGDIENGYFEAEDFLFGSRITYHCNKGFIMISKKDFRECLADGSWSNAAPVCEATICPPPFPIRNGTFHPLKDEYTYLDSVRYSCDDPKKFLNGEGSIYCNQNGSWSSPPPECVAVDCPIPNVPYSRKISGFTTPYSLNSVVIFDCYNGFRMNGTSTVKCNIESKWEPSLPDCLAAYCKEPTLINGYITGTPTSFHDTLEKGYNVGDTIQMKCNTMYSLKGDDKITCGSDFMWRPAVPICEKYFGCSSPVISNGQVILKNNKEYIPEIDGHAFANGDKIQIMCDPGFIMKEGETSVCDYKYTKVRYIWTPDLPVCVPAKN